MMYMHHFNFSNHLCMRLACVRWSKNTIWEMHIMDRILITAATGHTGNATAKLLLERGLSVRALVRKEDERSRELVRGAEIVTGNLRDFDSLRPAMKDVSRVEHLMFPTLLDDPKSPSSRSLLLRTPR